MCTSFLCKKYNTFLLMWLSYGSCYLLRRQIGLIKDDVQESMSVSDDALGYLDISFALPYAFCSITLNFTGDIFGPRKALGLGMIGSAVASSLTGKVNTYFQLCILLAISGSFQALCWPSACTIICSWFDKNISTVMAVYGSCTLVGGIIGSVLTVELKSAYGWRSVFLTPALIVGLIGVLALCLGRSNTTTEEENEDEENMSHSEESCKKEVKRLTPWRILCIPTLPEVSLSLFFTKGIKTAVVLWLPLYLLRMHENDIRMAGLIPIIFEVGGLIGSILIVMLFNGLLKWSDLFSTIVSTIMCIVLFPLLQVENKWLMYTVLFIAGAFSSTNEILLSGSLPSKIGVKVGAKSSVVGVVNGLGSLGNGAEGPIVAWLTYFFGIQVFVHVLTGFSIITGLLLIKAHIVYKRVNLYEA